MRNIFVLLTIALLLTLSGCATSVPRADKEHDRQAKTFTPKANLSNIYIYIDYLFGADKNFQVTLDDQLIGELNNHTFFQLDLPPGMHTISTKLASGIGPGNYSIKVKTAPGKNYFVTIDFYAGMNGDIVQVDEVKGKKEVSGLSMIYVPESVIKSIADDMRDSQQAVRASPIKPDISVKVTKPSKAPTERLVLMPLRVGEEDKSLEGAMETALVQGLKQNYIVFSGEQVAQKAREIFMKESRNTAKKECDETRCMQGIAEAFQAELIATANVTKRDGGYFLSLSIRNIFDNKVVYSNSVACKGCDTFQVVDKLKELSGI